MESYDVVQQKLARLESMNDQLLAELFYVDQLMRRIGFQNGLESVKETASELLDEIE